MPTYILHHYPEVDRISDNDLCFSFHFAASFFGMYFRMVAIGCKLKYFGKKQFRKSWKDKRSWAREYECYVADYQEFGASTLQKKNMKS